MYRIVKQLKGNEKLELDNLERCVLNNAYFSVSPLYSFNKVQHFKY